MNCVVISMTQIKVCGLKREEDVSMVNEVLPDFAGFVFAESKRKIDKAQAAQLKKKLDPRIKAVGVFVNEPIENIRDLVNESIIDLVQLHGDESEQYIAELRKAISSPIIKAIRVQTEADIEQAQSYDCDYLLFDAWSKEMYGGSGRMFDWSLVQTAMAKPFFLAGGLSQENIEQAAKTVQPTALDVSSGVETDGFKDADKIRAVVDLVRSI